MADLLKHYPMQTPWAAFSVKLVSFYNLPHGSRFALKRKGAAANNARTIVRSDINIRRKRFGNAEQLDRHGNLKASEVYKRIENMLAPHHRRFSVIGFGPDGERVDGHTSLKAWRSKTPKPTLQQIEADVENASNRQQEIATLIGLSRITIVDLAEGIEDPEQKVPQAMIHALLDHFGKNSIKETIAELRLV